MANEVYHDRACVILRAPSLVHEGRIMVMAEQAIAVSDAPALLARFASWMVSEQRRIFLICQRMLSDADEADSAVQDTFFKAYQALERHSGDIGEPGRWLTRWTPRMTTC